MAQLFETKAAEALKAMKQDGPTAEGREITCTKICPDLLGGNLGEAFALTT